MARHRLRPFGMRRGWVKASHRPPWQSAILATHRAPGEQGALFGWSRHTRSWDHARQTNRPPHAHKCSVSTNTPCPAQLRASCVPECPWRGGQPGSAPRLGRRRGRCGPVVAYKELTSAITTHKCSLKTLRCSNKYPVGCPDVTVHLIQALACLGARLARPRAERTPPHAHCKMLSASRRTRACGGSCAGSLSQEGRRGEKVGEFLRAEP